MAKIKCPECGRILALTIVPQDAPPENPPPEPKFGVGDKVRDRGGNLHTICKGPCWKMSYGNDNLLQWWYQTEGGCWRREKTLVRAVRDMNDKYVSPAPKPEPKPTPAAESFKPGDRVVATETADPDCQGRHGTTKHAIEGTNRAMVWVRLDGAGSVAPISCSNLRREEPKPEPKFKVGQWVEHVATGQVGRVAEIVGPPPDWDTCENGPENQPRFVVRVFRDGALKGWTGGMCGTSLRPHAPVLTDKQRWMLPGDKVRVIDIPVGPDGVPLKDGHDYPGYFVRGTTTRIYEASCDWAGSEPRGPQWTVVLGGHSVLRHNLAPVEEGGG